VRQSFIKPASSEVRRDNPCRTAQKRRGPRKAAVLLTRRDQFSLTLEVDLKLFLIQTQMAVRTLSKHIFEVGPEGPEL